jgi:hypothetical protein
MKHQFLDRYDYMFLFLDPCRASFYDSLLSRGTCGNLIKASRLYDAYNPFPELFVVFALIASSVYPLLSNSIPFHMLEH